MNILKLDLILFVVIGIPMALIFGKIAYIVKQKFKDQIKDEIYREREYAEAEAEFYAVNADMQQHLKDDGIIKPRPGSEADFQRWKAEREKQEG